MRVRAKEVEMMVDMRVNETRWGYTVSLEHLAGPHGKRFVVSHEVWGPSERKPNMEDLCLIQNIWGIAQKIINNADPGDSPLLDPLPANQYVRGEDIDEKETVRGRAEHKTTMGWFGAKI